MHNPIHVTATSLFLLLLILFSTESIGQPQHCDCGYVNENGLFTEYWYTDFNTYNSDIHRDPSFFVANYTIDAKYPGTFARSFNYDNVIVSQNALQISVTINNTVLCGSLGIKRSDVIYGSFRAWIKNTDVPGTVGAFFMYENNSEIDMETLSVVSPPQTYFAIHPGLTDPKSGRASALTHTNYFLNYTPSQDYHEYRFDWIPGQAIFYIDGKEANRLYTNIPTTPGRIMLNHWTDGNPTFSQGPPESTAVMEVKNLTMFFNSTTVTGREMQCQMTQSACPIDTVAAELQPTSAAPSPTVASQSMVVQLTLPTPLIVGLVSILLTIL